MNRFTTRAMVVLGGLCLLAGPSQACISPNVCISNWLFYVPLGGSATIRADESSGTYINYWNWSWSGQGITGQGSYYSYGYHPYSTRTLSFSVAGDYQIWAEAKNTYNLSDSDYARVYVVEVSSVKEAGTQATSIWVPVGGTASLQAQPNPSGCSWPSGKPTWSILTQPTGASATVTPGSNGAATVNAMTVAGLYRPQAVCGSLDDGASIDVTAIDVQIDTSFPATVALGGTLSLACTPLGATGGSFSWSKASGPGTVTFSPSATAEDPTFSASAAGTYTVQVQYTKNGATATKTSGTITVSTVSVAVTTPPTSSPAYVASGNSLELDCTPSGITNGTYVWSKLSGPGTVTFSNATLKNPTFSATETGDYVVRVQYTAAGTTVSGDSGTIKVISVDAIPTSGVHSYVAVNNSLQLDCTLYPSGLSGGTFSWSKASGPGTISFSNTAVKNPTFTTAQYGDYTAQVQYTVGGATVSDTTGTITAFSVSITTPSFPAFVGAGNNLQLDCTASGASGGTYSWSKVSGPGSVTFSNATIKNPTFSATETGAYTVRVQYTVGGATASKTSNTIGVIAVEITTPASFPAYVGAGATLSLEAMPDGVGGGSFSWSKVSGPGTVTFTNGNTQSPTFSASVAGDYTVQVQYTLSGVTVSKTSGTITVVAVSIAVPSSFPAYVGAGSVLQLDCTPTVGGGTYSWSQVSGPGTGSFSNATLKNPTFTATVAGDYVAQVQYTVNGVTVSDASGTITVISVSIATPSSFPAYVGAGSTLQLDCTPSGASGGTYSWFKIAGPGTGTFSSTTAKNPTFSASVAGDYTVQVQYTISGVTVSKTSGTITVVAVSITTPSSFPAYVALGSTLQLDCTPAGATGGTYSWSKVSGPGTVTFSNATLKNPTFTADTSGDYVVQVQYTSNGVTVSGTSGTITVISVNIITPSSFPAYVAAGSTLQLDCTPHGATTGSYTWFKISGPGTVTFSDSSAKNPTFTASTQGNYNVRVQYTINAVSVGESSGTISVVSVAISDPANFPTYVGLNHGRQVFSAVSGASNGIYTWSQVSGPGTATFSDAHAPSPTLSANHTGDYSIKLAYAIGETTLYSADTGPITIFDVNVPSLPAHVPVGTMVQLSCTPSVSNGTYTWSQTGGPGTITFSPGPHEQAPHFSVDQSGDYSISLTYAMPGDSITKPSGTVRAIAVQALPASDTHSYILAGSALQLNSILSPSGLTGTYSWAKATGPGTVSFSDPTAPNPTFSASTTGTYTVGVQCTLPDATVTDLTGPITVVSIAITAGDNYVAAGGSGQAHIYYAVLCEDTGIRCSNALLIKDSSNNVIRTISLENNLGAYEALWNGLKDDGSAAPWGTYTAVIRTTMLYGGATLYSNAHSITLVTVEVNPPSISTVYVEAGQPLQLECTPSTGSGSNYIWSKVSGPGSVQFYYSYMVQNPIFTATAPGDYLVRVQCTVAGVPVSATSGTISVVDVSITTPNNFPVSIPKGSTLPSSCTPLGGTGSGYSWTVTSPGVMTPTDQTSTTFSTTAAGRYTATIQCNVAGYPVSDTKGTIDVVEVNNLYVNWGDNWSQTELYVPPGETVVLYAIPNPADSDWPANLPTWSLEGPGGTLHPVYNTYGPAASLTNLTAPGVYHVTAHCGSSSKTANVIVVKATMQLGTSSEDQAYMDLGEMRQLTLSVQPEDPNVRAGQGVLQAITGGEKIRVWQDPNETVEVNLPVTLALAQQQSPITLWVKTTALSSTWDDVQLKWSFVDPCATMIDEDTLSLTIIDVDMFLTTNEPYVDGALSNKVVQVGLGAYSSLNSGIVTLTGVSGYDTSTVRFWVDEARTEELYFPCVWDLSNPNTVIPQTLYMEITNLSAGSGQVVTDLRYGRDANSTLKTCRLNITALDVYMTPMFDGDNTIEPDMIKPLFLGISSVPSDGHVTLEALEGGDYVRVWADEEMTTEVTLPATWFFPSDELPEQLYLEGLAQDVNEPVTLKLSYHINPEGSSSTVHLTSVIKDAQSGKCYRIEEQIRRCILVNQRTGKPGACRPLYPNVLNFRAAGPDGQCPPGIACATVVFPIWWGPLGGGVYPPPQVEVFVWRPYPEPVKVEIPCSGVFLSFAGDKKTATVGQGRTVNLQVMLRGFTPALNAPPDQGGLPYAHLTLGYNGAEWVPGQTQPGALRLWAGGEHRQVRMSTGDPNSSNTPGDFVDNGRIFIDWLGLGGVTTSNPAKHTIQVEGLQQGTYPISVLLSNTYGTISDDPIQNYSDTVSVTVTGPSVDIISCDQEIIVYSGTHVRETPTQLCVARGYPAGGTYEWDCSTTGEGKLEIVSVESSNTVSSATYKGIKPSGRSSRKDAQLTVTYTVNGTQVQKTTSVTALRPFGTIAFAGAAKWEGVTYRRFYHQVFDQYGRVIDRVGMPCDEDCQYVYGTRLNKQSPGTTLDYGPARPPMPDCEYGNWPGGVAVLDTLAGWETYHPDTLYHQKLSIGGWLTSPSFDLHYDPMDTQKPCVWKDPPGRGQTQ